MSLSSPEIIKEKEKRRRTNLSLNFPSIESLKLRSRYIKCQVIDQSKTI